MKRHTLMLVGLAMFLSGLAFITVLFRLAPLSDTGWLAMGLFFVSGFIFFASFFTMIGALTRMLLYKNETYFFHFIVALRQGLLFSIFINGFFGLSMLRVGNWWNVALLFASTLFIELYFLNKRPLSS